MLFWSAVAALFAVSLVVGLSLVGIYNKLVQLNNLVQNGFAQIEIQLKRRYDLIPNLVEATKAYLDHEHDTLEEVIAARNQAAQGLTAASANREDPQAMKAWMNAEGQLAGALGRLNFVMEDYPELKANRTIQQLTEELTSTENRIAFSRQAYNDWVTNFNSYRQSFPTITVAAVMGYPGDMTLLEMEDREAIQEAPRVVLT